MDVILNEFGTNRRIEQLNSLHRDPRCIHLHTAQEIVPLRPSIVVDLLEVKIRYFFLGIGARLFTRNQ